MSTKHNSGSNKQEVAKADPRPMTLHRQAMREIDSQIRSNRPLIAVCTHEEKRLIDTIQFISQREGKSAWAMLSWDLAGGLTAHTDYAGLPTNPIFSQSLILQWFEKAEAPQGQYLVLVLKDFFKLLGGDGPCGQKEHEVVRMLRNIAQSSIGKRKVVVLTGTDLYLPPEIEKLTAVIDWPLPERDHIAEKIGGMLTRAGQNQDIRARFQVEYGAAEMAEIVSAFQGLTLLEIELLVTYSIITSERLDPAMLASKKRDIIRKAGLVDWIDVAQGIESIGGLHELKRWLSRRKGAFTPEAAAFGLPNPKGLLLVGVQGGGKCFRADTPILMHNGRVKLVQDVRTGDQVMGPDSRPRNVTGLSRGYGEMYEVRPVKGDPYAVNADHVLSLRMSGQRKTHSCVSDEGILDISVRDYLALSPGFRQRAMGYRTGVDFAESPVLLDPYFLGLWLGDGGQKDTGVTTMSSEIEVYLAQFAVSWGLHIRKAIKPNNQASGFFVTGGNTGGNTGGTKNPVADALKNIGVWGDKHIPHCYKANSREVRLKVLAGILDTDGFMTHNGFEITQKRQRLAEDIAYLARSLGLAATLRKVSKGCRVRNGLFVGTYYRVYISGDCSVIPTLLPNKNALPRTQRKNVLNTGISVAAIGQGDYFGFSVDGDHRFLLGDFTVTHNSLAAQAIASYWHLPLLRLDMGTVFSGIVGSSEENIRGVIKVAESVSPCVLGETRISLADGRVQTIENLFDAGSVGKVLAMDEKFKIVSTGVSGITKRTVDKVWHVKYLHGALSATGNHLQPVLRNGAIEWVRTDELKVGDFVASCKNMPSQQERGIADYVPCDARVHFDGALDYADSPSPQRVYARRIRGSDYVRLSEVKKTQEIVGRGFLRMGHGGSSDTGLDFLPLTLGGDIGYVMGLIDSDGYVTDQRVAFVNTSLHLHEEFCSRLRILFGVEPRTIKQAESGKNLVGVSENSIFQDCYLSYVNNRLLSRIFLAIRQDILAQCLSFTRGWLRGYFDGDGWVSDPASTSLRIGLTAKKAHVNASLREMLLRAGFPVTNATGHTPTITGKDRCIAFIREIGSLQPKRRARMEQWMTQIKPGTADRTDRIPVGSLLKQAFLESNVFTTQIQCANPTQISLMASGKKHPSRKLLRSIVCELEILACNNPSLKALKALCEADVLWSPITFITSDSGEFDVYDMSCEHHHNFIANGIVTHNCVLWIDEMEKGMSGTASSNHTDGGTASRVFGSVLTWMQEKTAPVYVVATANDVSQMPPELLRKGRFDEIFFVDLPSDDDRAEIVRIHLEKRGRDSSRFDIPLLVGLSKSCTGAEIEAAVVSALYDAFDDGARDLCTADVARAISDTVPLAVTMAERIAALRKWASTRARNASVLKGKQAASISETRRELMSEIDTGDDDL